MTVKRPDFDSMFFRSALGRFPTGVTIITAETPEEKKPVGLTISSFNSVSLDPPMVLWTLSKTASSLTHFLQIDRYVIHVLGANQASLARQLAKGSQTDRFQGVGLKRAPNGTLMLADECAAWFECYNTQQYEAGDHIIFIGQVERCGRLFGRPLVYHSGDFDLTPLAQPIPTIETG